MYALWYAAIVLALLGDGIAPREARRPGAGVALIGLLAVAATVIAICELEYLTWTKVGDGPLIQGIQGRYAIPLLPMIAIALPLIRLPFSARLGARARAAGLRDGRRGNGLSARRRAAGILSPISRQAPMSRQAFG